MKRLRSLAPWLLLGPITGPLMAGVVRSLRGGRPVLAGLYGFAVLEAWLVLSLLAHNVAVAAAP
jgi:hypothetical protein